MKLLLAPTEPFVRTETASLAAAATLGSNVTLTLINNDNLAQNDFIVIGFEGNELCEIAQINAAVTAGTTVRVATLKFNHQEGEPVTRYAYDKRKFYGSTTATGAFAELTADGSPVAIQVDDPMGTRLEYTGTEGYTYFKATYYNSQLSTETDTADSDATLANETLRYSSLYAIRKHAGLAGNARYSDFRMETKRKQAENEINSAIAAKYTLPLTEVPPLLGQICELLGAGYIDYEEFGANGEGVKWLGSARSLLKAIQDGNRLLIGADGTQLTLNTKIGVLDGYPNNTDTDAQQFSMTDRY